MAGSCPDVTVIEQEISPQVKGFKKSIVISTSYAFCHTICICHKSRLHFENIKRHYPFCRIKTVERKLGGIRF